MCTGRVDPAFIIRAFKNGMDGVFIGGCWPGECHYLTEGNYLALSTVNICKRLLAYAGINPERLRLEWISAAEGSRFAGLMNNFSENLKSIGPLGNESDGYEARLDAVNKLIPYIKLVERERFRLSVKSEKAYDDFYKSGEFERLFRELIEERLDLLSGGITGHRIITNTEKIDHIIDRYNCEHGSLIQVLLDIQGELNWLPEDVLKRIGERLNIPLNQVRHAATFYKAFSLVPKGRHKVHVCVGTACHVRGASRILDSVEQLTGLNPGETDTDMKFSLETVNCLGCCALGPVAEIDGRVHGKMTPGKTFEVLKGCE